MWCAVSVDGRLDVNVALNRPSYQSSLYSTLYPRYANDGSHSTSQTNGPCAATSSETNPWWAVDLGVALYVVGVKFTSRHFMYVCSQSIINQSISEQNHLAGLQKLTVSQLTV